MMQHAIAIGFGFGNRRQAIKMASSVTLWAVCHPGDFLLVFDAPFDHAHFTGVIDGNARLLNVPRVDERQRAIGSHQRDIFRAGGTRQLPARWPWLDPPYSPPVGVKVGRRHNGVGFDRRPALSTSISRTMNSLRFSSSIQAAGSPTLKRTR